MNNNFEIVDMLCCLEKCRNNNDSCKCDKREQDCRQFHVHEILGSLMIAERKEDPHNHRFATVSGQAIPIGNGDHVHEVEFRTDFYEEHFHLFKGRSGGMLQVGGGRHVHFAAAETTVNDGHKHEFRVAALINDPIGD